ncbi:MAG: 3-hydroxyacyl-CoA dehydrogenase NAD-binding domain-containing protein, partial [Chthoniobacteraceae bacterium]
KLGLIDDIAPREYVVRVAGEMLAKGKHPHSLAHSGPVNAVVDVVIAKKVRADVEKRTRGNYPAVEKALEVILHGSAAWNEEASLKREREAVAELVQLDSTRNLIRLFFLQERAKKRSAKPGPPERSAAAGEGGERRAVEGSGSIPNDLVKPEGAVSVLTPGPSTPALRASAQDDIAVIGAGVMGAGIAQWLSTRGQRVILRDLDTARVAAGMATISRLYDAGVKRHVFTETEARAGLDRIFPAPTEVPLDRVSWVIEAAVEKMAVKKAIFQNLDDLVPADAILATNTSALSITELAAATRHPGRVIGIHFFNPVHTMQLVEVVTGEATSPEVTQRVLRFVQSIGKLPVLVRDSPGFLVNRILLPYLIEAGELFAAGADPAALDESMLDFGMPMGPLRLIDEVGVDVAADVAATLAAAFPDRIRVPNILGRMESAGLLGKKSAAGFFRHESHDDPKPNPDALALRASGSTPADAVTRLTFLMINEAARCLEERVVENPADVDFGMVMGTGWAPFRGGPLRYADSLGARAIVEKLNQLADTAGPHFAPCARLVELAKTEGKFYED